MVSSRNGRVINWSAFRSGLLLGIAIASMCAAAVIIMGGCEATVPGPRSGQRVSIEQAQIEYKQIEAEKKAEAQAEDAAFRRQVDKFQRQAKRDIAALNIECAEKAQQLQDNLDEAIAQLEATHNASVSARETLLASTFQTLTLQIKEAQAKAETWANLAGIAEKVAPAFGPFGSIASIALGIGGMAFGWKKKNEANDANANAEEADAKHADTLATVEKIVDALDIAKEKSPEFAKAFSENGVLISEWMGSAGKALVSQMQQHQTKQAA